MSHFGRNSRAQRVEILQTDFGNTGGAYRLAMLSADLTVVAAATSTAGHIAAFRNASTTLTTVVDAIRVKLWTTVLPTALQQISLGLVMARAYTVAHTGGAAATVTTNNGKLRTSHATLADIGLLCGTTGALTAGTHTLDAQNFANSGIYVMAAGAAAHSATPLELTYAPAPGVGKIILAKNEGIVVVNNILMGTAGKYNISVEVDFHVVDLKSSYQQ